MQINPRESAGRCRRSVWPAGLMLAFGPRGTRSPCGCAYPPIGGQQRGAKGMIRAQVQRSRGRNRPTQVLQGHRQHSRRDLVLLATASIGLSASLKLASKNDWALFVGQWPPTFILFGLYHASFIPAPKPELGWRATPAFGAECDRVAATEEEEPRRVALKPCARREWLLTDNARAEERSHGGVPRGWAWSRPTSASMETSRIVVGNAGVSWGGS